MRFNAVALYIMLPCSMVLGVGTREVSAYGCIHCQHLQLAVSFSEEDLQGYQQFEGEQPGVLERKT